MRAIQRQALDPDLHQSLKDHQAELLNHLEGSDKTVAGFWNNKRKSATIKSVHILLKKMAGEF